MWGIMMRFIRSTQIRRMDKRSASIACLILMDALRLSIHPSIHPTYYASQNSGEKMGWASYYEDTLKQIEGNFRRIEDNLRNDEPPSEEHRRKSLQILGDARVILSKAWEHLERATSPELKFSYEIKNLDEQAKTLENKVKLTESNLEKSELESANHYAELQDAINEIAELKKKNKKLEKDIGELMRENFAAAVEVYSTPGMIEKHKPKGS